MLYDEKDIDSASPAEEESQVSEEEEIVRKKSSSKSKKSSSKSKKKSKSSKSSSSKPKKSKAIIEDDSEGEEYGESTAPVKQNLVTGEEVEDDSDEDEDEEAAEGEFNGFIDDDNEGNVEEDEVGDDDDGVDNKQSSDGHKKKKKKKKEKKKKKKNKEAEVSASESGSGSESLSSDNSDLSEDDIDLIKSNLQVTDLEELGIAAKKRRRIRMASESSEEEIVKPKVSKKHRKKSHAPREEELSENSEAERIDDGESVGESGQSSQEEGVQQGHTGGNNVNGSGESDEGSFIVDDSDDENKEVDNETREAMRRDKEINRKKKSSHNDEAQQEALDIFGVNAEELGALSDENESGDGEYDEDEEEMEDEYDSDEDEKGEGDEDDYTQKTKTKRQKQQRLKVMHKMEDIFEPQELVKNLLTEFDQQVRIEDKPERFMLRSLPVSVEPSEHELEREAKWIFTQAFSGKKTISNQGYSYMKQDDKLDDRGNLEASPVIGKIKDVLNFIRNEFLEVPFIAFYRKEYITSKDSVEGKTAPTDLDIGDLWKIYEMDEKFCQLKTRKENFVKLLERMQKFQTTTFQSLKARRFVKITPANDSLAEDTEECLEEEDLEVANKIDSTRILDYADLERVRSAQTVEEFLDCYQHFHLHYGCDLIPMKEAEAREKRVVARRARKIASRGTHKVIDENGDEVEVPNDEEDDAEDNMEDEDELPGFSKYAYRKDRFHHCKQAGIWTLANKFGLSCEQFGENLSADYQMHDIDQCAIEPQMLAMDYVREPYFQNVDQVLQAVKYMMSIQLAKDPTIRGCVRDLYMQNACINVRPILPRGLKEIDEAHPIYPFKYLAMKPCSKLQAGDYYKLDQAEKDGLISMKFECAQIKKYVTESVSRAVEAVVTPQKAAVVQNADDDDWDDDDAVPKVVEPVVVAVPVVATRTTRTTAIDRTIIEKLKAIFHKDEFSYNVEQWNTIRAQVIEDMCVGHLWPEFEKELRGKLLREAKAYVFEQCSLRMRQILSQAPYTAKNTMAAVQSTMNLEDCGLKVLSIAYSNNDDGDEKGLACATLVNGNGEMEEYVGLRHLSLRLFKNKDTNDYAKPSGFMSEQKEEKIADLEKLIEFILKKKPDLIVLAAENKQALDIQRDLTLVLQKVTERDTQLSDIPIELISTEFSKLFKSSKVSEADLGLDIPNIVKQSIAMARQFQDPLLCYAQLCNQERDILALKLHPMMQTIIANSGGRLSDDSSELLRLIELEFINSVNQVGVDINRCNIAPHTSHVLQFVSGLGPRKAQHIVKVLRHQRQQDMVELPPDKQTRTHPVATNRLFLVTKCTLGRRVFINCAGFIKYDVDMIDHANNEEDEDFEKQTELLDSTRIHPEHYDWARKMGVDAMDMEDQDNEEINSNSVLKDVIEDPKVLKDLDLDAFANELERTGYGKKNQTLYDIRTELSGRYKDTRKPYEAMSAEQLFYCLLKETPESFYVGKLTLARVIGISHRKPKREELDQSNPVKDEATCMWQCEFCKRNDFQDIGQVWNHFDSDECSGPPVGVRCVLSDNGCMAFLHMKNISDSRVDNPEERIKTDMTIHARIMRIDPDRFSVEITSKTSDLRDLNEKWRPMRDEWYDVRTSEADQFKIDEKKRKEEHRQTYQKRIIAHPQFKNIGYAQAAVLMSEMDIGDALIRPSSKGNNHLTLSWKINKNCYQHIDILEDKKQNEFSIGKRLIIDGEEFEDLDEILARYIGNLSNYVREIMNHKNYREAEQINSCVNQSQVVDVSSVIKVENIERALLEEREKNKAKIPYMFSCCAAMPGKFLLSYLVKVKLRNEYIKITQEGFKFREKIFATFNELITWFKQHFMDPLPVRPPPLPQEKQISSQLNDLSIGNQHRTPAYPPPPSRTPAHSSSSHNNNTAFDSIINNSQSGGGQVEMEPAEYSTSGAGFDDSYAAPTQQKHGDWNRGGGRGGRGGRDGGRGGGNRDYGNRDNNNYNNRENNDSTSNYRDRNNSQRGRDNDYRGGRQNNNSSSQNNNNNSFTSSQENRQQRNRPSRFTDNTEAMDTSQSAPKPKPADDDWDEEEPVRAPMQSTLINTPSSQNRFNNNKTPNYESASKTPNYAPNKTPNYETASKTPNYAPNKTPSHIVAAEDDWDDDGPAQAPMQALATTPSRSFANNKTPSYAPPPIEDADERMPTPAKSPGNNWNNNNNNNRDRDNGNRDRGGGYNNNRGGGNNNYGGDNRQSNSYNNNNYNSNRSKSPGGYNNNNRYGNNNTSQNNSNPPPASNVPKPSADDDWDEEPSVPMQAITSVQRVAPRQPSVPTERAPYNNNYSNNNNRYSNNNNNNSQNNSNPPSTKNVPKPSADDDWDDEPSVPMQAITSIQPASAPIQPVAPRQPYVPPERSYNNNNNNRNSSNDNRNSNNNNNRYSNNNNNNYNPPQQKASVPKPSAEDDWDDDEPSVPMQAITSTIPPPVAAAPIQPPVVVNKPPPPVVVNKPVVDDDDWDD